MNAAPWDAATYFQPVTETTVQFAGAGTKQLIVADPNRVALILSAVTTGCTVSTQSGVTVQTGISLTTQYPRIELTFADWGPLVQQAWYGAVSGVAQITVVAVTLSRWPEGARTRPRRKTSE